MTATTLQRFQLLWNRKTTHDPLMPEELIELEALEAEVLAEEAAYLAPATARLRAEVDHKAHQVALLESLLQRTEALLASPMPKTSEWLQERAEILSTFRGLQQSKETELVA